MKQQVERIVEKLVTARKSWLKFAARKIPLKEISLRDERRFFGAEKHRFQLLPPLSPEDVTAWETKYHVELPNEYKVFLTQIGAGGAGPYYGVTPLHEWKEWNSPDMDEQQKQKRLSATCVLREGLPSVPEEWLNLVVGSDWEERYNADEWDPGYGTLPIVEEGCGMQIVLVMNGPYRGRLCHLESVNRPVFYKHQHFLDWYESWLELVITGDVSVF